VSDEDYAETIEFSDDGIRLAIVDATGAVTHFDNWRPETFGGTLPVVGDYVTTLWESEDPESTEHYQVVGRYFIGEFKGDNCWWLLMRETEPTEAERQLFEVAREQSKETRRIQASVSDASYAELRKMAEAKMKAKPKPAPAKNKR
jgi:hypothetical protein